VTKTVVGRAESAYSGACVGRHVRLVALALVAGVFVTATCARQVRFISVGHTTGTCDGACEHYTSCKGTEDRLITDACLRECAEIFVDDGDVDTESLREFEQLDCEAVIGFVEGNSEQVPGASHATK
jgi:hypothetical protein